MYRLFEKAMLWELIPLERNPMGLVELKGVSKRLKAPRILTEEEFGALLDQLDHPYRCMVLLAGCTGLRISEVMGLRWSLIDFESLVMQVREGYARSQVTVTWLRAYPSLTCMTKLSKSIRLQRRPITSLIRRPVHPARRTIQR